MKNKEWLRGAVEVSIRNWWASDDSIGDFVETVKGLINQLDEPEKVVVPKFVAEWLTEARDDSLYGVLGRVNHLVTTDYKWHEWWERKVKGETFSEVQSIIAKAVINGYEVEKEPLFYIPLGVVRSDGNEFYLAKTSLDVIGIDSSSERYVKDKWNAHYYRFTEKEIKDHDERYWAFAVPVEEVDND